MDLFEYFENTEGLGVLATADADGNVDVALYGRPHALEDGTVGLIMRERLSYHNLTANPKAAYLFMENGPGYKGKRLYMTMVREETDPALIASIRRGHHGRSEPAAEEARLVIFQVDHTRPLTGDSK
jgi:hypothetical protein